MCVCTTYYLAMYNVRTYTFPGFTVPCKLIHVNKLASENLAQKIVFRALLLGDPLFPLLLNFCPPIYLLLLCASSLRVCSIRYSRCSLLHDSPSSLFLLPLFLSQSCQAGYFIATLAIQWALLAMKYIGSPLFFLAHQKL